MRPAALCRLARRSTPRLRVQIGALRATQARAYYHYEDSSINREQYYTPQRQPQPQPALTFPKVLSGFTDDLVKFSKQELEEVNGAEFLRVPECLSREWGYSEAKEPLVLKRDYYDVLMPKIIGLLKGGASGVCILGTSGVGKTGFLQYMLWSLLKKKNDYDWSMAVLKFHFGSSLFYIFTIKGSAGNVSCEIQQDQEKVFSTMATCRGQVIYFGDGQIRQNHWALRCKYILTASDSSDIRYIDGMMRLYIPAWSEKEILSLNDAVFKHNEEDVRESVEKWGGVPRYVLSDRNLDYLLFSDIVTVSNTFLAWPPAALVLKALNQSVFHYDIDEDSCNLYNQEWPVKFASSYIATRVMSAASPAFVDKFASTRCYPEKLRSAVLETLFHRMIQTNLPVQCKEMNDDGEWGPLRAEQVPLVHFKYIHRHSTELPNWAIEQTLIEPSKKSSWNFMIGKKVFKLTTLDKVQLTELVEEWRTFGLQQPHPDLIYFVPPSKFESFNPAETKTKRKALLEKFRGKVKKYCVSEDFLGNPASAETDANVETCKLTYRNSLSKFEEMKLRDELFQSLMEMGIKTPRPVQGSVLPAFIAGNNIIECSPPKSGCTTALCIGVLQRIDIQKGFRQSVVIAKDDASAKSILLTMRAMKNNREIQVRGVEGVKEEWHVFVGTPQQVRRDISNLQSVRIIAIDAAYASEMLHDQLNEVADVLDKVSRNVQIAIFTYAVPKALLEFICKYLKSAAAATLK